jgi:phosphomevalonate kinase
MKEMGNLSEVPIEPDEQTKLLDTCVSQAGVIGGGVPGGMLFFLQNALERLD